MAGKNDFWGMGGQSPVNSLAWKLFASLESRSPIEQLADTIADGTKDPKWGLARQRAVRAIRRQSKGVKPRENSEGTMMKDLCRGVRKTLEKKGFPPEEESGLATKLFAARGPFTWLAIQLRVDDDIDDWIGFSGHVDNVATRMAELKGEGLLVDAKLAVLSSSRLDEDYWSWPSDDLQNSVERRTRLGEVESWDEFEKHLAILGINIFLSWISQLDVQCTCRWFPDARPFPLFLPLLTRPIKVPISDGETIVGRRKSESDGFGLPISNLILLANNMLASPKNTPQKWWTIPRLRLQDLLSRRQFHALLVGLGAERKSEDAPFPGCGLQLLTAANAFSLLTLRDGALAKNDVRRKKASRVTHLVALNLRYEFWWRRHRQAAEARGVPIGTDPWPPWFSQSLCDETEVDFGE